MFYLEHRASVGSRLSFCFLPFCFREYHIVLLIMAEIEAEVCTDCSALVCFRSHVNYSHQVFLQFKWHYSFHFHFTKKRNMQAEA